MGVERSCAEQIVWRRLSDRAELRRVRDSVCGLLSDCEPELVVSVLMFVDDVCLGAFAQGSEPITTCLVRAADPPSLRIDVSAAGLLPPRPPAFVRAQSGAGWGITTEIGGTTVWAYLALTEARRTRTPWARQAASRDPSLN
jgi:hypothetical protein